MSALAGEERPTAAVACPVIGTTVAMLAISVTVVAVPDGAARRIGFQKCVRYDCRVPNDRILGASQTEADELQEFGAYLIFRANLGLVRSVPYRQQIGKSTLVLQDTLRRYPYVVRFDPQAPGQVRIADTKPALSVAIPEIRELECPIPGRRLQKIGPD